MIRKLEFEDRNQFPGKKQSCVRSLQFYYICRYRDTHKGGDCKDDPKLLKYNYLKHDFFCFYHKTSILMVD